MTDADLLRRAATRLRDPYRCNTDPDVDHALAEVFDRAADAIRELQFLANTHRLTEPGLAHLADLLAVRPVARAILREPASGGVVEPSGPLTAEDGCTLTIPSSPSDPKVAEAVDAAYGVVSDR